MPITAILPDQVLADGASEGDVLTVQAGGSVAFEAPAGGGIGGSTGSTDNAILRADSTGGSTLQSSAWTIDDNGFLRSGQAALKDDSGTGFGLRVQANNNRLSAFGILSLVGYYTNFYWILGDTAKATVTAIPANGPSGKESSVELKSINGTHVRNTTESSPAMFAVYNTWTSSTSYERLDIEWSEDVCTIQTVAGSAGGIKRGVRFGGASTDELGFFGATPVDQPATVADPSGGSTVDTEARAAIAAVIDRLQELGLIA
jgi:hypothetical protein